MGVDRAIDITAKQRKIVTDLLERHLPNTTAWVYGSRAKWTSRPQSDLDLVVFATPEQNGRVSNLREALEESNLPFRVDLFVWDAVPEQFRKQIKSEHVVLVESGERDVVGEWPMALWGEIATLEYGKSLRGYDSSEGPYRVYGTNGPIGWHSETLCSHPSVIIGRKGAYRGVHYSASPFFVIDTAFYLKPNAEIDTRWAYYELLTQDINGMDSGSAIPSTSREDFYGLPVQVPPLHEQRAIAHILGTLDNKIELNRRMNETLEAMARALFKSWFVDFEPVRAKMAGRNTGLPKHLADLFPDRMMDSELGEIPEGWGVTPLRELIEINPKRLLQHGELAPYLDMANMPTKGHVPDTVINRHFGSGMRFANGDTLVARITPCLENGKTAYVDFLREGEIGWGSTEYIVMRPKPFLPSEYAYCLARSASFREFAIQNMTGTSGRQRVPAKALSQLMLPSPPEQVVAIFGRSAQLLLSRASKAVHESRTLATLRDSLLPKLISGMLHAKGRDQIVRGT